jgi:hypothetical protein
MEFTIQNSFGATMFAAIQQPSPTNSTLIEKTRSTDAEERFSAYEELADIFRIGRCLGNPGNSEDVYKAYFPVLVEIC